MKISVIICTYNAVNCLSKTLDSLLEQTFNNFEVIIVDGASVDGTRDVIIKYENKFEGRFKWISEKDKGIYNAMNKGVNLAQGEYLNILGAGDWLEKDAIENAVKCIKKNPQADAVHGKLRVWNKEIRNNYLLQSFPFMLENDPMQHPALFYKKDLHSIYGLYDESYKIAADYLFCLDVFFWGEAIAVSFDDVVDNYVTDGISSTNTFLCGKEKLRALKESKLKSLNFVKTNGVLPLVSVIVPTYNQELYITETLDSVIKQKYTNWECIVIDDGSTDKTKEIVKNFIKKDNRFKYITQKNLGPSAARNNGILQSKGEYILPLDSDDIISSLYINTAINIFIKNPKLKLVYCKAVFFGSKSGEWKLPEYSYDKILFNNMIFCTALYRRSDYNKTQGYNINMKNGFEDWDFWLSLLQKNDFVYKIPHIYFFYRIKSGSRSAKLNSYKNEDIIKKMYKQIYLNHEEKYRGIINPIYTENQMNKLHKYFTDEFKKRGVAYIIYLMFFSPKKFIKILWFKIKSYFFYFRELIFSLYRSLPLPIKNIYRYFKYKILGN